MQVFTKQFKDLVVKSKRLILSDDQSDIDGSISNDDIKRLKQAINDLDAEVMRVVKLCDEANRVYKLENTLTDGSK